MKTSEIMVGHVYRNAGAGRTTREVIAIERHAAAPWLDQVVFSQPTSRTTREYRLSLKSFARWAGTDITTPNHKHQTTWNSLDH